MISPRHHQQTLAIVSPSRSIPHIPVMPPITQAQASVPAEPHTLALEEYVNFPHVTPDTQKDDECAWTKHISLSADRSHSQKSARTQILNDFLTRVTGLVGHKHLLHTALGCKQQMVLGFQNVTGGCRVLTASGRPVDDCRFYNHCALVNGGVFDMIALFDTRLRDCHLPALSVVIRSLKHNIRTVAGPSSPAAARAIQVVSRQGHPTQTTSGSSQFGGILVVLSAALHPFVSQATSLCAGRLLHLVVGRVHMIFLYGVAAPKSPSQLALAFDLAQALRGLLQTLGTDALVVVVGDMNAVLHTTDRVVAVLYPWDELLCSLPKVLTHEFGFHDIHYEQHLRHTPHDAFHPSFFHCDGSPCSRLDQCFFSPSAIAQSRSALPSMATMSALARSPGVKREYGVDHSMGIVAFVCLRTYMCTSTCFLKGGPVVIAAPPGRAGPGRWAPTSQNKEAYFDILSSDKFVALFLDLTNQLTVMKTGDDWSAVHHAAVQLLLDAKALAQPRAKAGSRTTQSDAAHDKLRTTMQAFVGAWHALTSDITTMHPSDLDRVTATLLVPPSLRQQSVLLGKTLNGLPIPPFQADSSCAYECLQTSALWLKWAAGPLGAVHRVALLLARDPFWVIYDADVQTWIPFRSTHPSVPSPYKTPSDVLRPQDASRVDSIICLRSEPALGLLGQPMITADAFRLQAHIMTTVEIISAKKTVKFSFDTLTSRTSML